MAVKNVIWAGIALLALLAAALVTEIAKVSYEPAYGQAAQLVAPVVNNAVVSATNPLPTTLGGTPITPATPLPVAPYLGGLVVSNSNPLPEQPIIGGAAVSFTNPLPISGKVGSKVYGAAVASQAHAVAGDLVCITGSASKIIKVKQILISGTSTGSNTVDLTVALRSSLDTGGTPTVLTNVPYDSTNAAATAVVTSYAIAPTLGTAIGNISAQRYNAIVTSTATTLPGAMFSFDGFYDQQLALNTATQAACVNVTAAAAALWDITIKWSEE